VVFYQRKDEMMTTERMAQRLVDKLPVHPSDENLIDHEWLIDGIASSIRGERARCAAAVAGRANDLPADASKDFYDGYKLALRNAIAAIRSLD
jgi:hypothetical protein